jgi:hypothetical protein
LIRLDHWHVIVDVLQRKRRYGGTRVDCSTMEISGSPSANNKVQPDNRKACRGQSRMKQRQHWMFIALLFAGAAIYPGALSTAHSQSKPAAREDTVNHGDTSSIICDDAAAPSPLRDALRQACLRKRGAMPDVTVRKAVIIGFVGGFVRRDDANHPEVQFAAYLRERYPSGVHAKVFANHEGQNALRYVPRARPVGKNSCHVHQATS